MPGKTLVPAMDGWLAVDGEPALLGTRCAGCGTYFFPREDSFCRNPECDSTDLQEVRLSRRGTVWSSTVNHFEPPKPYVSWGPFEPYAVAAVALAAERLVVLGQISGSSEPIPIGTEVELVVEPLYEDDDHRYLVWKWRPL
jgi:uncharacterized protein